MLQEEVRRRELEKDVEMIEIQGVTYSLEDDDVWGDEEDPGFEYTPDLISSSSEPSLMQSSDSVEATSSTLSSSSPPPGPAGWSPPASPTPRRPREKANGLFFTCSSEEERYGMMEGHVGLTRDFNS
jgi:hypothetical protein